MKNLHFLTIFFLFFFHCIFSSLFIAIFNYMAKICSSKNSLFSGLEIRKKQEKNKSWAKIACYHHTYRQLGFNSEFEVPQLGSAWLGTFIARLGSSWKIPGSSLEKSSRSHSLEFTMPFLDRYSAIFVDFYQKFFLFIFQRATFTSHNYVAG